MGIGIISCRLSFMLTRILRLAYANVMKKAAIKDTKPASPSNEFDKVIGARLKFYRLSREFSQTALGREAGITFQQIQKYENGLNRITVSRLIDFSRILDFSMAEFFDGICGGVPSVSGLPNDVIESLVTPQAVELNRSFAAVKSVHMRRTIVQLVRGISAIEDGNTLPG